ALVSSTTRCQALKDLNAAPCHPRRITEWLGEISAGYSRNFSSGSELLGNGCLCRLTDSRRANAVDPESLDIRLRAERFDSAPTARRAR
ncbi:MAG: hypothetical protein ACJ8DY_23155, partial [Xanthobacteraceae bacterium]